MKKIAFLLCSAVLLQAQTGPSAFDVQPGWHMVGNGYSYQPEGQAGPVVGRPFSATEVRRTTRILNDGSRVDQTEEGRFYRDSRGAMRMQGGDVIVLFDPVQHSVIELNARKKTYGTRGSTSDGGSAYIAIGASQSFVMLADQGRRMSITSTGPRPVKEDLPPTVINGIAVRGSRITTTIPAGTFGNQQPLKVIAERWYSDDLQALVKSSNSDPRFGDTTYELTNIVQAAPDPALFQIPADYTGK